MFGSRERMEKASGPQHGPDLHRNPHLAAFSSSMIIAD